MGSKIKENSYGDSNNYRIDVTYLDKCDGNGYGIDRGSNDLKDNYNSIYDANGNGFSNKQGYGDGDGCGNGYDGNYGYGNKGYGTNE